MERRVPYCEERGHIMSDTRSGGHMLNSIECNGIIFDSGLAQRLAELLLAAHYGNTEVERQRPLMTIDNGDHWHIEGSWNRDRKIEGKGPFFMSVQKHDGRVTDFGLWGVIHPEPRAKAAVERELRRRTEAGHAESGRVGGRRRRANWRKRGAVAATADFASGLA